MNENGDDIIRRWMIDKLGDTQWHFPNTAISLEPIHQFGLFAKPTNQPPTNPPTQLPLTQKHWIDFGPRIPLIIFWNWAVI